MSMCAIVVLCIGALRYDARGLVQILLPYVILPFKLIGNLRKFEIIKNPLRTFSMYVFRTHTGEGPSNAYCVGPLPTQT